MPPLVSIVTGRPSSSTTQRVALPQASTSPPSAFQIRILTSATSEGSSRITWSQPTPGAPVGDRPRPRRVHRHRALARVEDDEIVAEAVHLVEAGHVEGDLGLAARKSTA